MDPPYWETEGYGVEFGWEQYQRLAAVLGKPEAADERTNVTTYGQASDYEAYRSRHEQVFHSDHAMYAAARAMFERQIADLGL
ncbi:hypothetical protein LTR94_035941, partial [Friedmanniomyces endolithicus]